MCLFICCLTSTSGILILFIYLACFSFSIWLRSRMHPVEQVDHVGMCTPLQECSHFTSLTSPHLYCCPISMKGLAHIPTVCLLHTFQPEFVAIQLLGGKSEINNTFWSFLPDAHSWWENFHFVFPSDGTSWLTASPVKDQGTSPEDSNIICLKDREVIFLNQDAH